MDTVRSGTVYHVFCTKTGKCYIGQTWQTLRRRWKRHCRPSSCCKLWRAVQKYGPRSFVVTPLTTCSSQTDLDLAERYWIRYFDSVENGYNLREGGSGRASHSPESIVKMKAVHQKRLSDPLERQKYREAALRRFQKSEERESVRQRSLSQFSTIEQRNAMALAKGGRAFVCNETGAVFFSINEAARCLGLHREAIRGVLHGTGGRKQTGGYTFRYMETAP